VNSQRLGKSADLARIGPGKKGGVRRMAMTRRDAAKRANCSFVVQGGGLRVPSRRRIGNILEGAPAAK